MDQLVENLRKSVEDYNSIPSDGSKVQATRDIVAALSICREFLKENDKDERGQTQRFVREIAEWMAPLLMIRALMTDRNRINKLHTKREADEFLDEVQAELEKGTKELEDSRVKIIQDWVRFHPVLKGLKRVASKRLPKDAYVLLFEQKENENPKLITRASKDGRVLTRFHPREFSNETRLYQTYHGKAPLVGAAVIAKNELIQVIGKVPEASEGQEQLKALTSISKKAVGQPGREFVERNEVLKHIHSLCRKRKIDRQDYILLFENADFKPRKQQQQQASTIEAVDAQEVQISPSRTRKGEGGAERDDGASQLAEGRSEEHPSDSVNPELGVHDAEQSLDEGASLDLISDAESEQSSEEMDSEDADLSFSEGESSAAEHAHDHSEAVFDQEEFASDITDADQDADGAADTESDVSDEHADEDSAMESNGDEDSEDDLESEGTESGDTGVLAADPDSNATIEGAEATSGEEGASSDHPKSDAESSATGGRADNATKQSRKPSKVRLIIRQSEDGRVITRFRFFDFSDSRKLFEQFKGKAPVVGAAVIRGREVVHAIGMLPTAKDNQSQVDALLDQSRKAMEGPALSFITDNEVLVKLQELNASSPRDSNLEVVLFVTGQGRPEILSLTDQRGFSRSQFPLSDFRNPKFVFDRLHGQSQVIGASVISQPPSQDRGGPGGRGRDDRGRGRDDRSQDRGGKGGGSGGPGFRGGPQRGNSRPTPVVVHAIGQTPLKQNILLTPETLKRMNISLILR